VPKEVAASVADHPTDVVVSFDPAAGAQAMRAATLSRDDTAHREQGEDAAARSYAQAKSDALEGAGDGASTARDFDHLPVQIVHVETQEALDRLAANPDVTSVNLPKKYRTQADSDLTQIHQPQAAQNGLTGAGIRVAVVDSGINITAPDFGDCSGGVSDSLTGLCRVTRRNVLAGNGSGDIDTDSHHGSNVAGIVAKVAPNVRIDSYGVFKVVSGNVVADEPDVLAALNAVAADGVSRHVKAVNLSVGLPSHNTTACAGSSFASVFSTLRTDGIVPVVAAGNAAYTSGIFHDGVVEPACAPGALTVGAVYSDAFQDVDYGDCEDVGPEPGDVACFSQTGPGSLLSIYAPGVAIAAGGSPLLAGTSQAAPHVAGAIADLATVEPDASATDLATAVTTSATSIHDTRPSIARNTPLLDLTAAATQVHSLRLLVPIRATVDVPFNITVSAVDGNQLAEPGVSGGLTFTSTDTGATLPSSASLSGGTGTFSVTMHGAGAPTISASGPGGRKGISLPVTVSASAGGAAHVVRISGADRIATSIAVSKASFPNPDSAGAVVLASAENYPDGLAGTPLAVALHAPVLLTSSTSLPSSVLEEITRVLPGGGAVYVLGGTAAASDAVTTSLTQAGLQPHRISGADRYATAAAIAGNVQSPTVVLLATGLNFPDALAAGVAAGHAGGVVLFTQGTTQAPATQTWLTAHPNVPIVIVGGTAAVSVPSATSLIGADRYATAVKVAEYFFGTIANAAVASGLAFPDALSGGAHIGALGGPILLTPPDGLPSSVTTWFNGHRGDLTTVYVYGGTAAVGAAVPDQVGTATT
jgi:putative cell wall-binding protein